jgi:hypothetical protein
MPWVLILYSYDSARYGTGTAPLYLAQAQFRIRNLLTFNQYGYGVYHYRYRYQSNHKNISYRYLAMNIYFSYG